ncbi:hypothetical protein KEM56_000306 [Ascosphaera pollenicola]|nr:hypothetical protein KEM56_000306 [Ascosphaera pollenicola]
MDPSFPRLRLQQEAEPSIENWDDDGDLQCINDLQFRIASKAYLRSNSIVALQSARPAHHRDSISSRRSLRSDSNNGDLDDDSAFTLDDDDRSFSQNALSALQSGSFPVQPTIPAPAQGGQNHRDSLTDDWADGLDLSSFHGKVKLPPALPIPDSFSSVRKSPLSWLQDTSRPEFGSRRNRASFQGENNNIRQHENDTIRVSKLPPGLSQPMSAIDSASVNPFTTHSDIQLHDSAQQDEYEDGLEFPTHGTLKLALRLKHQDEDRIHDDIDSEWAEGSLGVRHGGTKNEQTGRYSAVYSPSISSRLTVESEDDVLDGLVFPDDPSDFVKTLQQRLEAAQSEQPPKLPENQQTVNPEPSVSCTDDFLADFDIVGEDAFDPKKRTSHQNIRLKSQCTPSDTKPAPDALPSLKPLPNLITRIPRPATHHDRSQSAHVLPASMLEPVAEGGTVSSRYNRSRSQLANHATNASSSSIPLPVNNPTTQSSNLGRNPSKRSKSRETISPSSQAPSSQGQKVRRSASAVRASPLNSINGQGKGPRAASATRSRTPIDRGPNVSRSGTLRRNMPPFLPAGTAKRQSHHANMRAAAETQRRSNSNVQDNAPINRSFSKSQGGNNPLFQRKDGGGPPQSLSNIKKQAMARPNWRKTFGDGTELDVFDDLPTSASAESKYVRKPSRNSTQRSLRIKVSNQSTLSNNSRSTESAPVSPFRSGFKPRFARDTEASRSARGQRPESAVGRERTRVPVPSTPVTATPPKPQPVKDGLPALSTKQHKLPNNSKPHLIRPMGSGVHHSKYVKGMRYNPALYRWEGNDNVISDFDTLPSPVTPKVAPALIANVGSTTGVQIVNGMVFDPQRMCWMKLARSQNGSEAVPVPPEEDEDPFLDLPDLQDKPKAAACNREGSNSNDAAFADDHDRSGDESDDWPITEEFDVGPEFIRRQRAEEDRWRRKVQRWVTEDGGRRDESWRWAIREIQKDNNLLPGLPKLPQRG